MHLAVFSGGHTVIFFEKGVKAIFVREAHFLADAYERALRICEKLFDLQDALGADKGGGSHTLEFEKQAGELLLAEVAIARQIGDGDRLTDVIPDVLLGKLHANVGWLLGIHPLDVHSDRARILQKQNNRFKNSVGNHEGGSSLAALEFGNDGVQILQNDGGNLPADAWGGAIECAVAIGEEREGEGIFFERIGGVEHTVLFVGRNEKIGARKPIKIAVVRLISLSSALHQVYLKARVRVAFLGCVALVMFAFDNFIMKSLLKLPFIGM